MDSSSINTVTSSEAISTSPITTDPSTSTGSEVTSETPPNTTSLPDARKKGPILPPPITISDEFDQGDYFNTSQQVQNGSLTHSTQKVPLVYTFAPPTAQNVSLTHHAPPIYTYAAAPLATKTQGICRLDADRYVEIENKVRTINDEMVNRKLKSLEDAMRSLPGLGCNQSV
ncbi:hypothetical protein HAX54_038506, partial [Datura stramonium]|nr:hypothetical protein [Datura stramonium]